MYYKLEEIANYDDINLTLTVNETIEEVTRVKTILTSNQIEFFLKNVYGDRILVKDEVNLQNAYNDLLDFFNYYKGLFQEDLQRLYDGWRLYYSPIENYDKYGSITTNYKGKEKNELTKKGKETHTETIEGYKDIQEMGKEEHKLTKTGTEKNTHKESAFNSPTSLNTTGEDDTTFTTRSDTTTSKYGGDTQADDRITREKYSNNYQRKNSTVYSGTLPSEDRKDTTEKTFTDRQDEVTEHTHGNIGVKSSESLLLEEFDLRMKFELENYLRLIVDKFSIMV